MELVFGPGLRMGLWVGLMLESALGVEHELVVHLGLVLALGDAHVVWAGGTPGACVGLGAAAGG